MQTKSQMHFDYQHWLKIAYCSLIAIWVTLYRICKMCLFLKADKLEKFSKSVCGQLKVLFAHNLTLMYRRDFSPILIACVVARWS